MCSTIDIMVPYAPGITVNDETHGQLKQLSVCLFFYAAGILQQHRKVFREGLYVTEKLFYTGKGARNT